MNENQTRYTVAMPMEYREKVERLAKKHRRSHGREICYLVDIGIEECEREEVRDENR